MAGISGLGSIGPLRRLAGWIIVLGPGFLWAGPSLGQDEAAQASLEVSFVFQVPSDLPVKGALHLRPPEGKGEPMRLDLVSPAPLSLRLPMGSTWEVSAEIPGFWARRKTVTLGPADQESRLSLDLWPLGKIGGVVKVKGEKETSLPKQVLVQTLAAPAFAKRPAAPKGALDCPVDDKGNWTCSLPAATYDLIISAKGLTPHYRWGVQVSAGKTLPLGLIALEPGASVAGWVAVEGGVLDPERCIARLGPQVAGGGDLKSAIDLGRTAREQKVRGDGFVQLTGLAPGTYTLEIEQPGYPPARVSPVRVDPGAETVLPEPILLRLPVDVRFEVFPPVDALGKPWRAQVSKRGERRLAPIVFEGAVAENGSLVVPGQSSGRFNLSLLDSLGNTLYSGEHLVEDANSPTQPVEVHFVTVEGRLRFGIAPLAATLWFGGRSGAPSSRMESDEEGWFHGVLPREGFWRVQVQAAEPDFSTWTRAEVDADRSGKASLDLVLPDTRIFGHVVDEQGKPVARADVTFQAESLHQFSTSDQMGRFEARGLPEGLLWLGAETSSRTSNRAFATLVEGSPVGPIELRLKPTQALSGTVLSPGGAVAGAHVMLLARPPADAGAQATTDTSGTFRVDLPKEADRLVAIAMAPGFALQTYDALAGSEPLTLRVADEGGELIMSPPVPSEELARRSLVLAVFQNGRYIPGSLLTRWAYDHGGALQGADGPFRIPRVAPGEYLACFVPQSLPVSILMASVSQAGCDSGLLAPGAALSLKPSPPE